MRWYIIRTLLHKDLLRHLADRGSLMLAMLLVVAAMLLSFFGQTGSPTENILGGVQKCYVDYWVESPWIDHLKANVPDNLRGRIEFRPPSRVRDRLLTYPANTGAIQVRLDIKPAKIWLWHPGADGSTLGPFEAWFWRETNVYFRNKVGADARKSSGLPDLTVEHSQLKNAGVGDARAFLAMALVIFGLFFVCVYLLPSLTCEERERGVLLAQALSPASPLEILTAKFLFYPVAGIGLATLLAGIYRPAVLAMPFFWLALVVSALGSMGVGLTIASIARTQRSASMGALCYLLTVSLILLICQQNGIQILPVIFLEYHFPRMFLALLTNSLEWYHWWHLAGAGFLAVIWCLVAMDQFRRRGWQ